MKYVNFTWLRLQVSLPIFNVRFLLGATFCEGNYKNKEITMNVES